jgi:prolyl oligopeptidase
MHQLFRSLKALQQSNRWCNAENEKLYIITNWHAPNRKLVITDATTPTPEYWKDFIPETKFP